MDMAQVLTQGSCSPLLASRQRAPKSWCALRQHGGRSPETAVDGSLPTVICCRAFYAVHRTPPLEAEARDVLSGGCRLPPFAAFNLKARDSGMHLYRSNRCFLGVGIFH